MFRKLKHGIAIEHCGEQMWRKQNDDKKEHATKLLCRGQLVRKQLRFAEDI